MKRAMPFRFGLVAIVFALGPAPAGAAPRMHVVTAIHAQPGAHAMVTLPNGRPEPLSERQTLPDGARVDVPVGVTVVIASTDAKSTTTLRPDTSFTLLSTGAGERSSVAHGGALFSVVHGALDFFTVKYGSTFTASARGTEFSFDTAGRKVTFACRRGTVDVAYAARLQIGSATAEPSRTAAPRSRSSAQTAPPVTASAESAIKAVDVIAPAGTPSVSFALDVPDYVQRFDTAAAALEFYDAKLLLAIQSRDPQRIAAAYNNRATVEYEQDAKDRALADYAEAIRADPRDAIAFYNRGNLYRVKGDSARAIADYDAAIGLDSNYAVAYNNRGLARENMGDYDKEIADESEAIRLMPGWAAPYNNRASAKRLKGDYAGAILDYDVAARLDPSARAPLLGRGIAYQRKGDPRRAILDFSKLIGLDPKFAVAWEQRGYSYQVSKDYDRAIADYGEAIRLDPARATYRTDRGIAYSLKGQLENALADYNEAVRLDPDAALALSGRGLIEDARGELGPAIEDLEKALRLNSKLTAIPMWLGSEYFATGDRERALTNVSAYIRANPEAARGYEMRGIFQLYGGPLAQARTDFDRAAALAPADPYAALLRELADRRSRAPSRLPDAVPKLDMTVWPAPIVRLFIGQSTPAATLAAAKDADPVKARSMLCEANIYTAEFALLQGSIGEAAPLYEAAARDCPDYLRRAVASAALKTVRKQP